MFTDKCLYRRSLILVPTGKQIPRVKILLQYYFHNFISYQKSNKIYIFFPLQHKNIVYGHCAYNQSNNKMLQM